MLGPERDKPGHARQARVYTPLVKILLVTPPMQDTHSPYPATAYLTGFLRSRGHDAIQDDFAIRVVTRLLSRAGVTGMAEDIRGGTLALPRGLASLQQGTVAYEHVEFFLAHWEHYAAVIDQVVQYLRGNDPVLKHRIIRRNFLPESPLFIRKTEQLDQEDRGIPPTAAWWRRATRTRSCASSTRS